CYGTSAPVSRPYAGLVRHLLHFVGLTSSSPHQPRSREPLSRNQLAFSDTRAFRRSTMRSLFMLRRSPVSLVTLTVILFIAVSSAQQGGGRGEGPDTLADTPQILGSRGQRFRVTPIKGLFRPS